MGTGVDDVFNDVFFARRHTAATLTAPALFFVIGNRAALDVVGAGQRHHDLLFGDQVFIAQAAQFVSDDTGAAFVTVLLFELQQFGADDLEDLRLTGQDGF